ncbi:MAG: hypothetical protein O7I93_11675 [Gemmatimonadetes bacterium]|nr:hypothetical protein [Gemmatimonadota bacterium]
MKNETLFKIERTFAVGNMGVVLGRQMGPGDLRFGPGLRLGGIAVSPWLRQPTMLTAEPTEHVIAFVLRDIADRRRFRSGDLVELSAKGVR